MGANCKLNLVSNRYAYEGQEGDCILLENCLFMDTSCVECSSGEKQCVLGEKCKTCQPLDIQY